MADCALRTARTTSRCSRGTWDPLLHPAARTDLAGVAPAHPVAVGYDVPRDEGEAYASRLARAGVPATPRRYDGLPHGFIRLHNLVDTADAALSDIAGVIRRACAGPT